MELLVGVGEWKSRIARCHSPNCFNAKFAKISAWRFAKVAGLCRRCKTPSPAPNTFLHKNDQTRGIDIEDGDSCRDVKIVTSRALRSPNLRLTTNNQRLIFHFMNRSIFKDQCPEGLGRAANSVPLDAHRHMSPH